MFSWFGINNGIFFYNDNFNNDLNNFYFSINNDGTYWTIWNIKYKKNIEKIIFSDIENKFLTLNTINFNYNYD